ncbi:MAG: glycosyltransferase family 39 protein [Albidovulum sp.]|uniref:ArnT family glycosyltransferase n=1 Tax=Albidovulum sp. TaxID=1872424 RepID=UPI0030290DF0
MARGWFGPAAAVVAAVTAARIAALAFDRTDLFVDESQYWLWGQQLDLGYYSKPPLIAWVIRAVTELSGSDAPFFVRLPGAILHGITALILGAVAARLLDARAAVWTAVTYLTLPMAALGSLLISTDTVMAPFFAGAVLIYLRAVDTGRAGAAALAGVLAGLAVLAKYAGVYFLIGAGLAATFVPMARLSLRGWLLLLAAFAATVLPNLMWNLANQLATLEHTMDNVGWVRGEGRAGLNPAGLAEFLLAQFAVAGPVVFAAMLWGYARPVAPGLKALALLSAPPLVIVCVQALLDKAYANWAVAAYFAGTVLAVAVLGARAPRLLPVSLAINGAISVLLPLCIVLAPWPAVNGEPLLARYLGRGDLSRQIIAAAERQGLSTVAARDRDILADLFYTGRASGLAFAAPAPAGRPRNYYEQTYPLGGGPMPVLLVAGTAPRCVAEPPVARFATAAGAYSGRSIAAWRVTADCANAAP